MATSTTSTMTADQLFEMSGPGVRFELIDGEIHRKTLAGFQHGSVASVLLILLGQHVRANKLGKTCAAETGFLLSQDPDTVRAPDAAFVSHARLEGLTVDTKRYLPVAPDLVAEVVSPNDSPSDVESKARYWLESGVITVLVIDPATKTLKVHQAGHAIAVLNEGDTFLAGDVVPGWQFKVAELFE
jgi:Uma2 family endonuclease